MDDIKFFDIDRPSESKTVFFNLNRLKGYKECSYRKVKPQERSYDIAEISRWCDVPASKSLWVKLIGHGNNHVVLDSEDIIDLARELMMLKIFPKEVWDMDNE